MTGIEFPRPRLIVAINLCLVALYVFAMPEIVPLWLAILIQSVRASIATMVVIIYGWSIVQLSRENRADPATGLVIGIFIAFLADLYGSIMGLAWRWSGRPADWPVHMWWQIPAVLTTLAGVHHIAVPDAINGRIPRRSVIWLGVAFGLACMIAGIIIGMQLARFGVLPT